MSSVDLAGYLAGSEIEHLVAESSVIHQQQAMPDRQYPEVIWDQYGLVSCNEIAVTAKCGTVGVFAKAPSLLIHSPMADRVFGMDVMDSLVGDRLAATLWDRFGTQLAAEALRVRRNVNSS